MKKNSLRNLLKRIKNEKRRFYLILSCIGFMILCLMVGMYHVRRIYNAFGNTTYEYMFDRAQISSSNFTNEFSRKGTMINSEALVMSDREAISKDNIVSGLNILEKSGEFDYAIYISNRNTKYMSDGKVSNAMISDYEDIVDPTIDYSVFRNIHPRKNSDELCFASAVKINGLIQGYLIGVVDASKLFEMFDNESSTSVAERYLVDQRGDIIIYTKGDDMYDGAGRNIYTILTINSLDDYDAELTIEEIKNQLITSDMVRREINLNGNQGYVMFKGLSDLSGWSIFYIVYDKNVQAIISPIIIESIISLLVIMLIMILMSIMIMRYLSQEQKRMYELAFVDELTKAPNENAFKEKAEIILRDNPSIPYIVMAFDIFKFRYINEGYGHVKADILLRALSGALASSFSYNETFARVGADRFVALCVDDGRLEERKKYILDKIKETTDQIPMKYPIRLKIGIYYVRNRKETIADMMDKANLARKSIDNEARSLEAEYRESLMESTKKQENIESRMEAALENHEFVPYLQGKWNMEEDHICGAEALVRWRDKDGKIVPPGDFIPLFEKNGFIEKIDFYMLEEICKYIRRMLDENREVYPVSINQSRYLMYDPNYLNRVQEILLRYKIPRGLVELELTETVFFQEKDRMIEVMRKLKELNMSLSIDDFGSGYSSLNLLRDIPFDVLKIDRGFLDESSQTESGQWILRKIVEMAKGLNLHVICEGVENQEQVDMLLNIGCKTAQGFLYARPIPLEEFVEKYNHVKEN